MYRNIKSNRIYFMYFILKKSINNFKHYFLTFFVIHKGDTSCTFDLIKFIIHEKCKWCFIKRFGIRKQKMQFFLSSAIYVFLVLMDGVHKERCRFVSFCRLIESVFMQFFIISKKYQIFLSIVIQNLSK